MEILRKQQERTREGQRLHYEVLEKKDTHTQESLTVVYLCYVTLEDCSLYQMGKQQEVNRAETIEYKHTRTHGHSLTHSLSLPKKEKNRREYFSSLEK